MEKGELKTGQLLGIIEKNGKLIREYVAGFFGDEPIIKQRLLTPQEARRYREDKERGLSQGKSAAEAESAAGGRRPGSRLGGKPHLKKKLAKPGVRKVRRPTSARGTAPEAAAQVADSAPASENGVAAEPRTAESRTTMRRASEPNYTIQSADINDTFIQTLIDSESDKPNFNPANRQQALDIINRIGSPDMKIYQIGARTNGKEGYFYSQKEFLVRSILGLPMWKARPQEPEPEQNENPEAFALETAVPVAEAEMLTAEEAATDAKFDA